ncbi:Pyruvate/Phosphoenolpyruvate kinase-like domain-containing protein [Gaertneriomyces semiglobifer]|nr:Pyruvate/Phosphoenolpyruvate kinase-like domain-containing protein [Gaertneriomyces semiglobifer]
MPAAVEHQISQEEIMTPEHFQTAMKHRPPKENKLPMQHRRTKIVGTLGPASVPLIKELIEAGINIFRLNFSHIGDPETQTPIVNEIRKWSEKLDKPVAILGDLGGPKIRCNDFKPNPTIPLTVGKPVRLVGSDDSGTDGVITTKIRSIVKELDVGQRVLLDDGSLVLRVSKRISPEELECEVVVGGVLKAHKGINVPDIRLGVSAVTEKDKRDAEYAFKMRFSYVALSFVQTVQDVDDLKTWFQKLAERDPHIPHRPTPGLGNTDELERNWRPRIILKIEKPQALDIINELVVAGDGIMVARGDMGVEISLEKVPIIQKMLIRKCNTLGKPVITATQMLESMISSPSPTRAEVSDVANAVFDGTDAVMLSAECATGKYPVETVTVMASICESAESGDAFMNPKVIRAQERPKGRNEFLFPVADAAIAAAAEADVSAIIIFTTEGDMAIAIAKRRPRRPVIAVTSCRSVWRRLSLFYGVYPILTSALIFRSLRPGLDISMTEIPPEAENSPTKLHFEHNDPVDHAEKQSQQTLPGTATDPKYYQITPEHSMLVVSNTDQIYAQAESDIKKMVGKELGLKQGDAVVFCAGFHLPWPGLSNTVRLARFGDAIKSKRARSLWGDALRGVVKSNAGRHDDHRALEKDGLPHH